MKVKVKQNPGTAGGCSPGFGVEKKYKPTKKIGELVARLGSGGSGIMANITLGINGSQESGNGQGYYPLMPTATADDFAYSQDMFGEEEVAEVLESRQDGSSQTIDMPIRGQDVLLGQQSRRGEQLGSNLPRVTDFQQDLRLNDSDYDLSPGLMGAIQFSDSDVGLSLSQLCENHDLTQIGHMPQGHPQNMQAGPSYALPQDNTGHYMESAPEQKVFTTQGGDARRGSCPIDFKTVLENWTGDYHFKVTPVADSAAKQKIFYSTEINHLFCKNSTAVPFKFEMNYTDMPNLSEFTVRAALAFEEPDKINDPVLMCTLHKEKEKNITDEKHANRLVHILRPSQPVTDTEYIQSTTGRCYLSFPANLPEPGMSCVIRSFVFACLNSCQGANAISRKPLSLLFCLFDMNGRMVGRSFMHLKICSAPQRDFNKAMTKYREGTECRKRRGGSDDIQLGLPDPKKFQACEVDEIAYEERTLEAVPSTSRAMTVHTPAMIRSVVTMSKAEEDPVSSSQETVYSCDESEQRINLRSLVRNVKHVLGMKRSSNVCLNQYARSVYNSLKLTQDLCVSARTVEEGLRHGGDRNEKSPDGGFDEQLQD